jgi:hypothetical protein
MRNISLQYQNKHRGGVADGTKDVCQLYRLQNGRRSDYEPGIF